MNLQYACTFNMIKFEKQDLNLFYFTVDDSGNVCNGIKWATSWENLLVSCVNYKGADQPVHPRSLISTFVVHCPDSIMPTLAKSKISRLWLAPVAEQAGLSLTWSQTPKTSFLVTGLKWYITWWKKLEYLHGENLRLWPWPHVDIGASNWAFLWAQQKAASQDIWRLCLRRLW